MISRLRQVVDSEAARLVLACAVGGAMGVLAWGDGRDAALAALLPVVLSICKSRAQAFLLATAYRLAVERHIPAFASQWFGGNLGIGLSLTLASCVAGAVGWSLAWTASGKPWRKAAAILVAWTVTLLPPFAVVTPAHPVIAWGYITPGLKWLGLILSVAVPAGLVWKMAAMNLSTRRTYGVIGVLAVALVGLSFTYKAVENRYVNDIVAITTNWGSATEPSEILGRIEKVGKTTKKFAEINPAGVVIYPESILYRYDPSFYPVLKAEVLRAAAAAGQTVVLGMDLPSGAHFQTVAVAFYPNGQTQTALARQTVPFALWKPWAKQGSFTSNWSESNMLTLRDGVTARIVFCYEEYMPVLGLANEVLNDHQIVVVMANTWANSSDEGAEIQSRHSEGFARLFGRKLVRAENRPKPPTTTQ